jgi:CelD/BcsL family acetyltransferase involved in cellulose biosynthesis
MRVLTGGHMDITAPAVISVEIQPAANWPAVAPLWSELVAASRGCSIFLTREWIETWLEVYGDTMDVSIAVFRSERDPAGACLLARSTRSPAMIPLRRISLNAAGERASASTYIEYNDLLARSGCEEAVAERLAGLLYGEQWDELALDGFVPGPAWAALKRSLARFKIEEVRQPSHYIDLAALRRSSLPYEMVLGHTTRKHLRQNLRAYASLGQIRIQPAHALDEALRMFDELSVLNRRRWTGRRRSVFDSALFIAFHRKLIGKCFGSGAVQLLRVSAGAKTIGIVYHLVRGRKIYFYQCGLDYPADRRLSPGPAALSQVIQWCLDRGFNEYDFLSGDEPYKRRLATESRTLVWTVFRRPRLRVRLMEIARAAKHWAVKMRKRTGGE